MKEEGLMDDQAGQWARKMTGREKGEEESE